MLFVLCIYASSALGLSASQFGVRLGGFSANVGTSAKLAPSEHATNYFDAYRISAILCRSAMCEGRH